MKTQFNYQILLSKVAKNQYQLHNQKQEWKMFIAFVFLMKVITWVVSMFAGFYFFRSLIFATWGNMSLAVIATVFILVAIEGSTNVALAKFFKFAFRGTNHFATALTMGFLVLLLFGISFYSSTNGLAMKQARKVDNTSAILQQFADKKRAINRQYSEQIADIDAQISTIKQNPQGWTRGRRTTLLTWQLNKIDSLLFVKSGLQQAQKNEISALNEQKNYRLSENKRTMTAEADKYYSVIMVIMVVQFIVSGILMFFWKKIHLEDDADSVISEEINEMNDIITSNAFYALKNRISDVSNAFTVAMLENAPVQKTIPAPEYEEPEENERVKIAGFGQNAHEKNARADAQKNVRKNAQKTVQKTVQKPYAKSAKPSIRIEHSKDFADKNADTFTDTKKNEKLRTKYIRYLDKHKAIVRAIRISEIPEKDSISNDEVRQIQRLAARAKHKSSTLIRDVYRVAVTVGLNLIDENGNVVTVPKNAQKNVRKLSAKSAKPSIRIEHSEDFADKNADARADTFTDKK